MHAGRREDDSVKDVGRGIQQADICSGPTCGRGETLAQGSRICHFSANLRPSRGLSRDAGVLD